MSTVFDMDLFLTGVLTGSHTTRQRHLRQAKAIQTAIAERWQRDNPWTWQRKHCAFHAIRPPSPPTSGHPFHAHPARQSERSDAGLHC